MLRIAMHGTNIKLLLVLRYTDMALRVSATYLVVFKPKLNTPTVFNTKRCIYVNQDSSVGIADRYRLDDPWIESGRGRERGGGDFPHPSRPALGTPSFL
jgi:hypothetical protein